uniref:Uncharacterized protein n=1 Tax=Rhizophora mucronata TaxID=61149 RepID=A0A2P2M177_RHIMU
MFGIHCGHGGFAMMIHSGILPLELHFM